jgi:hypothetical protein
MSGAVKRKSHKINGFDFVVAPKLFTKGELKTIKEQRAKLEQGNRVYAQAEKMYQRLARMARELERAEAKQERLFNAADLIESTVYNKLHRIESAAMSRAGVKYPKSRRRGATGGR